MQNMSYIQTPQIKNHTATLYNKKLYVFGGYDGKKNHSNLRIYDTETLRWIKPKRAGGTPPPGRNGHTATLVGNLSASSFNVRSQAVHFRRVARIRSFSCG